MYFLCLKQKIVPRLLPCPPPVLQRQSLGSGPHSASHPPRILSAPIGPASCPHDPPHSLVTFQMSKPQLIFFLIPWQRLALFTPDCFFPLTFVEITLQSEVGGCVRRLLQKLKVIREGRGPERGQWGWRRGRVWQLQQWGIGEKRG